MRLTEKLKRPFPRCKWTITSDALKNDRAVIQARFSNKGTEMAKKTVKLRPWTATDIHKLKGLAKKKAGVEKIARVLKRTTRAVENKSYLLGVSLDTRG
jgi:hypothetical protein